MPSPSLLPSRSPSSVVPLRSQADYVLEVDINHLGCKVSRSGAGYALTGLLGAGLGYVVGQSGGAAAAGGGLEPELRVALHQETAVPQPGLGVRQPLHKVGEGALAVVVKWFVDRHGLRLALERDLKF